MATVEDMTKMEEAFKEAVNESQGRDILLNTRVANHLGFVVPYDLLKDNWFTCIFCGFTMSGEELTTGDMTIRDRQMNHAKEKHNL